MRVTRIPRLFVPWLFWAVALGASLGPIVAAASLDDADPRGWHVRSLATLVAALALAIPVLKRRDFSGCTRDSSCLWCAAAVAYLLAFLVFVSNRATLSSGDNLPSRALPVALLRGDGFDLSGVVPEGLREHYSLVEVDGSLRSAFPLGTGVLATPYYAVARGFLSDVDDGAIAASARLEKAAAATLAALATALVFVALASRFGPLPAVLSAALFAFGTPVLTSSSQALWSTTGELLAVSLSLLALRAPGRSGAQVAVAGAGLGVACFCRPTALLLTPVLLAWQGNDRSGRRWFLGGLVCVLAPVCVLHLMLYGHVLGGYGLLNTTAGSWSLARYPEQLAGVLAGPSRGLLWYFPVLVIACSALVARREARSAALVRGCLATAAAIVALTAGYTKWWGGYSLGPRLLTELALPLAVALPLALSRDPSRRLRVALALAALWQVGVSLALEHSSKAWEWNGVVFIDNNPEVHWSLRNSQLAALLPGWTYAPTGPYLHANVVEELGEGWRSLALGQSANARYDQPDTETESWRNSSLPRLARDYNSFRRAPGLRFLPPGGENLARVCSGERLELSAPDYPVRRIRTVLLWREAAPARSSTRSAGRLVLEFQGGRTETRELVSGRDVFDTRERRPDSIPPVHRMLAGSPFDADALVLQNFTLAGKRRLLRSIALAGPPPDNPGCLFLTAISAQLDSRPSRERP